MKKKYTHGGSRKGSGRPKLKESEKKEPTVVKRVPLVLVPAIDELISDYRLSKK